MDPLCPHRDGRRAMQREFRVFHPHVQSQIRMRRDADGTL
jgi:hypothetical protein